MERYSISANYYNDVTGELDKANAVLEQWAHSYPRDLHPLVALALNHNLVGQYDQAVAELHEGLRINPDQSSSSTELTRHHPDNVLQLLLAASPCELGEPNPQVQIGGTLYPGYVRGQADLENGEAQQAVAEFQKLIDHRGVVQNFVLGALVHLQLGRAYLATGDDPDIPILEEAKAEYVTLQ